MKLITAIVRMSCLEQVVCSLEGAGIRGIAVSETKELGEELCFKKVYMVHDRIEVIVPDDLADRVVDLIVENSRTGLAGDGIIAVRSLDYAVQIRTKERMT